MKSIDGAYQRVNRAGVHLTNLNRRVNALCKRMSDNVVIERKPQVFVSENGKRISGVLGSARLSPTEPVPGIITILVGEIAYNLRASLDYLVYELACMDSRAIVNGTQFPIEDTQDGFRGRPGRRGQGGKRRSYLRGVNNDHAAMIERLQPYNGCHWTRTLRDLSNPDKHRRLTVSYALTALGIPQGSTEAILAGQPVDMKNGLSVHVLFRDGTSDIGVGNLYELKSRVAETLHLFDSEFK